jgi:hypothetical protein
MTDAPRQQAKEIDISNYISVRLRVTEAKVAKAHSNLATILFCILSSVFCLLSFTLVKNIRQIRPFMQNKAKVKMGNYEKNTV